MTKRWKKNKLTAGADAVIHPDGGVVGFVSSGSMSNIVSAVVSEIAEGDDSLNDELENIQ